MSTITAPESIDDLDKSLSNNDEKILFNTLSPINIDSKILLDSSLVQWVISKHNSTNQAFELASTDINNINLNVFRNYHEIAFLLLNKNKIPTITPKEVEKYKSSFFEMQNKWPDLDVSQSACLFCSDDRPGTTRDIPSGGLASQLYNLSNPELTADIEEFQSLIENLSKAVSDSANIRGKITEKKSNLAVILYELFTNTHIHARRKIDGGILESSVRGVYSRFYSAEVLKKYFSIQGSEHLNFAEEYASQFITNPIYDSSLKQQRLRDISGFIEFTVFDSGPGLVAKWLGNQHENANINQQKEALINCFSKGKSTLGNNQHGYGLWKVLEQVNQLRGLVRIRTNKLHVATQFMTSRHPIKEARHLSDRPVPTEEFYDWKRRSSTSLQEYPSVKGTLISILVPMGDL